MRMQTKKLQNQSLLLCLRPPRIPPLTKQVTPYHLQVPPTRQPRSTSPVGSLSCWAPFFRYREAPGALPPLIGWSAATGSISQLGWLLFGVLFVWQMPHFYALSWMFKDDYSRAGFKMLSGNDPDGKVVAQHSFAFAVLLSIVTLLPTFLGFASGFYFCVAGLINLIFLIKAFQFLSAENKKLNAQKLFFASIIYLPLILLALLIDYAFLNI